MKNLVLITSVIAISDKPLSYTKTRSVYSTEDRYNQTLKTIDSVNKIPNKIVIFIETSDIPKDMEGKIKSLVDYYINFNSIGTIKSVIDGFI